MNFVLPLFFSVVNAYTTGSVLVYKRTGTTWCLGTRPIHLSPTVPKYLAAQYHAECTDFLVGAPSETINGLRFKGAVSRYKMNAAATSEIFQYR